MPDAIFFERFGWYIDASFLSPDACERITLAASDSPSTPAGVVKGQPGVIDRNRRLVSRVCPREDLQTDLRQRLAELAPALARHFKLAPLKFEEPQLLRYGEGDFYALHRDNRGTEHVPRDIARRRLSLIVFLNQGEDYEGGQLVFRGLFRDARARNFGLPLEGKTGMLIAFPSGIAHEVRPVTRGTRWSLVSWLY